MNPNDCDVSLAHDFLGFHQARGASLVERHATDVTKAKKAVGGKDGGKKTFSWSREEDFEQRRSFTPQVIFTASSSTRLLCVNLQQSDSREEAAEIFKVDATACIALGGKQ